jgi:hypothetical protein
MRARVERSLRKICAVDGLDLAPRAWQALRAGYEDER